MKRHKKNFVLVVCAVCILLGALFKIQHYPGAGMLLMLGVCILLIFVAIWLFGRLLSKKDDDEQNIDSTPSAEPAPPNPQVNAANNNIFQLQQNRANQLLQLKIITAEEFGVLNTKIVSDDGIFLTEEKFYDILSLNNMKERGTLDDFMFDMQKSQILGLKYLPNQ